ncbi:MAG: PAS domain S-box protein [Natronomonas sp.]
MSGRPNTDDIRHDELSARLLEESTDVTAVVDPAGSLRYVSPAAKRVIGYEPDELVGEDGLEFVHPADRETVSDAVGTVSEHSEHTVEFRFECPDGSWSWIEATMRDRRDDDVICGILVNARDVTDRKTHERDLLATKERLKLAVEGANLGIWDWKMQTDDVSRDELLTDMLGYTQSEMGTRLEGWKRLVHPADRKRHNRVLAEHVKHRTPYYQCDHRLRTKADGWKWVRTMGKVVERDEDGTPVRAVGIHQDIDDRKRAELVLEEERQLFREGPVVVFKWGDTDGWPIEYVSDNVEDVFGYTPRELERAAFAYLVHDDDLDRVTRAVADERDRGTDRFTLDPYRIRTADGEVRWVMEYTTTLQSDRDNTSLLGYLVDITERKEYERQLEASEQTYRRLFEDTRDALMLLDRDGFFDCNQQTLELFDVDSVDDFVEYAPWDLSPATQPDGRDSKEAALEYVETAFEDGEAFFQWTHCRTDGTPFPAEVKLSRFDHDGDPALHAMVRDITERRAYQQRIETQRDNLEMVNQMLRHDIRNDIQLITAYAEFLSEESDEAVEEYVEKIRDNADHAVELTVTARELADVMLSAEEDLHPVDLRGVLQRELEEVRSAYPGASIIGESDVPAETILANDMLGSVFRNLLKNAIQHNDEDVPVVTVSATKRDDSAVVRIADNGPGVPDDQKTAIFGKGEKGLDSQGSGFGLYLTTELVDSYDGDVWVEDPTPETAAGDPTQPDDADSGGAVFVVELPIAE